MKHQELAKLQKEFDSLPDEEKIHRLATVAQYYLGQLTRDAKVVVDVTKYWSQFKMLKEEGSL